MNPVGKALCILGLCLLTILGFRGVVSAHGDSATDGLIDGGGNPAKDCVAKFQTGLELNYPAAPKRPRELRCTDGDLACDTDGIVNGSCTIPVGLCFLDDADPLCELAGLAPGSVEIKNKPLGHRRYDADAAALQVSVDALLGAAGLACDNPGAGGGNCLVCTETKVPVVVSLDVRRGKKKIKLKATTDALASTGRSVKDVDNLRIRCLACENETFAHLSQILFKTNCASAGPCHGGGAPAAGLSLDPDVVGLDGLYAELVDESPSSWGAATLGMNRITPGDSALGTPASTSLLYEKLFHTNNELDALCAGTGLADGCLGLNMPPGSDVFSTGKMDLLRAWIEAGAPRNGFVDGATCGEPEDIWQPATALAPPAPGEGFQIHMEAPEGFWLAPGDEFQGCQWIEIPSSVTEDWYINRVEIVANHGTHHILLYEDILDGAPAAPTAFDPTDSGCSRRFGQKFFRMGTQDPEAILGLPGDTYFIIPPGHVIGVNPHYVNNYNVPIQPEVWVNFYGSTTPGGAEARLTFVGDSDFSVAPGVTGVGNLKKYTNSTGGGQCYFALTSHQHRRGTGFKMWSSAPSGWNDTSDRIYYSRDWDHPDVLADDPPYRLQSGQSLWYQCEWDNGALADVTRRCQPKTEANCQRSNRDVCFSDADCDPATTSGHCGECALDFGPMSEDEMCFLTGFWYPEQPGPEPCPWSSPPGSFEF